MRASLLTVALACAAWTSFAEIVTLVHGDSTCTIDTHGARVLSCRLHGEEIFWNPPEGSQDKSGWWHGGMPIAWPWYGRIGSGETHIHGYAWKSAFAIKARTADTLVLSLATGACELEWTLKLDAAMTLTLRTINTSRFDVPFSVAFHPYFKIGERDRIRIEGFDAAPLAVTAQVDRSVSSAAAEPMRTYCICDPVLKRTLTIEARRATGANLWNPGMEKACPGVIPGDEWRRFISLEPFARWANRFQVVAPGASSDVTMKVSVH